MDPEDCIDEIVTVTKGKLKGETGYCDDIEGKHAIVYFGSWEDGYNFVRCSSLVKAESSAAMAYNNAFRSSPERWFTKTSSLGH